MDSLVKTFHIDFGLLLAQAINFLIVFLVLYYFALKPLFKVMQERSDKIAKSLKQAEEIEKRLSQADEEYEQKLAQAKREAKKILEQAQAKAEKNRQEAIAKTKAEIGEIINKEKEKIRAEKAQVLKEIKAEVSDLVVLALEKIIQRKINGPEDKRLIKKIIQNINK